MIARHCLPLLAMAAMLTAADAPNLSGTWRLNVDKSTWGKKAKPVSVIVQVEHHEPELKYSGKVIGPNNEENAFQFTGAIDGQEHPVTLSYGPGKIKMERVNAFTISSVYKSDDGRFTETATTVVSPDGKTLTRRMNVHAPDGDASWTEVYERQ